MANCAVFGCNNSDKNCKNKAPKVRFLAFPSGKYSEKRRIAWIRFAKRKK